MTRPTVEAICNELYAPTGAIGFCRHVREGRFHSWAEPAEIYIEALGAWLRCDGSHAGFALNGQRDYARNSQQRLRKAIDFWVFQRAHAPPLNDILKVLNATQQPADWDGTFNGAVAEAMLALMHMKPEIPK